jgi:hypothetical protein
MKEILIPLSINESASANIISSCCPTSKTFHLRVSTVSEQFSPLFCAQTSAVRRMANYLGYDKKEHLKVINQFNEYRGQTQWTNSDFDKYWRKRHYQNTNPPAVAVPPFPGWQNLAVPESSPAPSQWEEEFREAFLEQTIPEITADPAKRAHWKGIKYLGGGGGGRVGLWEYTGPGNTGTNSRRVAVKEVRVDNAEWDNVLQEAHFDEGKRLERLQEAAQSSHIITLQTPLPKADANGQGKVRRLVFEYCDMGDLKGLINIRCTS